MTDKNTHFTWDAVAEKFADLIASYSTQSGLRFESDREAFLTLVIDAFADRLSMQNEIAVRLNDIFQKAPQFRVPIVAALDEELVLLYADPSARAAIGKRLMSAGISR